MPQMLRDRCTYYSWSDRRLDFIPSGCTLDKVPVKKHILLSSHALPLATTGSARRRLATGLSVSPLRRERY